MADRIELFEITTPAGTLSSAPISTALTMLEGRIDVIELTIPGGHAGLTGLAFFHSGVQVIPKSAGTFLRGDDQSMRWEVARYPTGAKWTVKTYNLDVFSHTHHLRLLLTDVALEPPPAPVEAVPVTPEATPEELAADEELPEPDLSELADIQVGESV